ncbi:hypothetical protein PG989_016187 [Apiospora arundinis]
MCAYQTVFEQKAAILGQDSVEEYEIQRRHISTPLPLELRRSIIKFVFPDIREDITVDPVYVFGSSLAVGHKGKNAAGTSYINTYDTPHLNEALASHPVRNPTGTKNLFKRLQELPKPPHKIVSEASTPKSQKSAERFLDRIELRRENLASSDNSLWLRTKRLEAELLQELKMHRAIVELGLGIAPQIFGKNDLVELRGDVITNYATKPQSAGSDAYKSPSTVACHAAATMPLLDRKVKARGSTRSQIKEAYQAIWIEFDNACRRLYAQAAQVRRAKQYTKYDVE